MYSLKKIPEEDKENKWNCNKTLRLTLREIMCKTSRNKSTLPCRGKEKEQHNGYYACREKTRVYRHGVAGQSVAYVNHSLKLKQVINGNIKHKP